MYRRSLTVTVAANVTNAQLLYNATDFGTLYSAGQMQADCDDIRFTDNANPSNLLTYYTEFCDTTGGNSLVWIQANLNTPSTILWMYYSNPIATSGSAAWSGNLVAMFPSLPAGWTNYNSTGGMLNRFPYGAATSGTQSGSDTHTHTTTSSAGATTDTYTNAGTAVSVASGGHSHTPSASVSTDTVLPPYLSIIFASRSSFVYSLPSGTVIIMNGTIPSGWSQYASLTNAFPRGANAYGATGGSSTHTHTVTVSLGAGSGSDTLNAGTPSWPATAHTHGAVAITSGSDSSLPDWFGVVYINNTATQPIQAGMVLMFTVLPPLGWTRVSGLDNRMPYGQNSFGGTGSGAHTHSWSGTSTTYTGSATGGGFAGGGHTVAKATHTHTISGTLQSVTNLPAYSTIIFGQRLSSTWTVTVGSPEYIATTYTTATTSQTITTVTNVTSTLTTTSVTMLTSTITNTFETGGINPGIIGLSLKVSVWTGMMKQTETISGEVEVSGEASTPTTFMITDAIFNAPWITLDENRSDVCGCYKTFMSGGARVPLQFKASPSLDVPAPMVYDITMTVTARTSGGFVVSSENKAILVTVNPLTTTTAGPVAWPIPQVEVPPALTTGAIIAGAAIGGARLYVEYKKRKEGF